MDNWKGERCRICGLKTLGSDLCNEHYEQEENMDEITIKLNKKEFTTVLAGLRYLQANHGDACEAMSDLDDAEGSDTRPFLLTPDEIDVLCERINIGE